MFEADLKVPDPNQTELRFMTSGRDTFFPLRAAVLIRFLCM